jgi:MFS family permease
MHQSFISKHKLFFGAIIFSLASLFLFFEMALQVSPSIMTGQLMAEFNINASVLGIMASCYFYSYTAMQIPSGLLYDRFGPRILICLATLVCSLGALFFGFSHTVTFLAIGRFLLGIGSAFAFVGVLAVAAKWFPPSVFALFVGITQFLAAVGAMSGALPLAYAVDTYGWRDTTIFLGYSGIILAILCGLVIRNSPSDEASSSTDHKSLSLSCSFKEVISQGQTWALGLYSFTNWAPALIFPALWGVPYLMRKFGLPNTKAALATSLFWIGVAAISPFLGWISDLIQRRKILLTLSTLVGLIASCILLYVPSISYTTVCILLFFIGAASSGNILCFAVAKDINRPSVTSTAMGFNNMAVVCGGAVFQPICGWILAKMWDGAYAQGAPIYTVEAFDLALSTVPLCYLIGLVASMFFIKETYCKPKFDTYLDQLK